MKKVIIFLTFILFFAFTLVYVCCASDINEEISYSVKNELNEFMNSLPKDISSLLPKDPLNNSEILDEKSIFNYIISYIFSGIDKVATSFASLFSLIIISSILSLICSSLSNSSLNNAFKLCSLLCISITVFQVCINLTKLTGEYIKTLCKVMNAFLPLMSTMGIMSGSISTTATSCGASILAITLTEGFLVVGLLPLVKASLALSIVKPIGGCNLSGISKTLKNTFTSITVFIMSILLFILSTKNVIAQGNDSISIKTARFAISSFVPIVGASINDALRTLSSSLAVIKSTCGIIAIIAIALLMIPLIVHLLLYKLSFGFLGSICKALNCTTECDVLEEADSLCGFLLVLVACTCVMFIFSLTIFINVAVGVA